jgi:mono/diheme cytochrome c family protein
LKFRSGRIALLSLSWIKAPIRRLRHYCNCVLTRIRRPDGINGGLPMKRIIAAMTFVALVAGLGAARAQDAGESSKGHEFARQICAECHAVEKGQPRSPNSQSPTFETIATTPGMTSIALTAALRTSHRTMPNLIVPDDDLKNVIAYVLSLR